MTGPSFAQTCASTADASAMNASLKILDRPSQSRFVSHGITAGFSASLGSACHLAVADFRAFGRLRG